MDDLPNMKCFSLTYTCSYRAYDIRVLPLLRRMNNLEELTLNIQNNNRTKFTDGIQIIIHKPYLRKFTFYISTEVKLRHLIRYPSNEDIQQTFTSLGYIQVGCILTYFWKDVDCHVFSLPFAFNYLGDIGNSFPQLDFIRVTSLGVFDRIAFEHEFFLRIARCFPRLRKLDVDNSEPQSRMRSNSIPDNDLYSTAEFPNLVSLRLGCSNIFYVEQFLNARRTHLPNLKSLMISYNKLRRVTKDFTRNITRQNCAKVTELDLIEKIVHCKNFYDYFPLL